MAAIRAGHATHVIIRVKQGLISGLSQGVVMNRKRIGGLVGIVLGGAWLANNIQYFDEQGLVAVGMPLLILIVGIVFFIQGRKSS